MTGEKHKHLVKNLSQCHSVHHKAHVNYAEIDSEPRLWQAGG
jgi:hypothetical protein